MVLIICVDRDDDVGRKAGIETPIVGREDIENTATKLGIADPEDSDLNALFAGMRLYDETVNDGEDCEIAVVTGSRDTHRNRDQAVAKQLDAVLEEVDAESAIVVTDGAEDESIMPVIESRLRIDGVERTIVKQAQNLENAYHVVKRLLSDPDTRGTVLVPIGIALLIIPFDIVMSFFDLPNAGRGIALALLGGYFIMKGLGMDEDIERMLDTARDGIYSGKVSLITYLAAAGLTVIGAAAGLHEVQTFTASDETVISGVVPVVMAFIQGSIAWLTTAGVVSSLGRIVDEYIKTDDFPRTYLNGPFYVVSMGLTLHAVSGFFIGRVNQISLAVAVVIAVGIGMASTAVFGGIGRGSVRDEEIAEVE
jgi:putative membrane protein